jgi:hypothetical protein
MFGLNNPVKTLIAALSLEKTFCCERLLGGVSTCTNFLQPAVFVKKHIAISNLRLIKDGFSILNAYGLLKQLLNIYLKCITIFLVYDMVIIR